MSEIEKRILKKGMIAVESVYRDYLIECLKSRKSALEFNKWFEEFTKAKTE